MKTKKLIEQLERYQRWRKGADIKQPEPFEVTEMLDAAIVALQKFEADKSARVCPTCDSSETVVEDCFCADCGEWFSIRV